MDGTSLATGLSILWLLGFVLVVVWVVLPFAILGTKPLLRELLQEQRRTNELLKRIARNAPPTA
jgi:threonine/homoserine/homoserine lactone efflux protein